MAHLHCAESGEKKNRLDEILREAQRLSEELDAMDVDWMVLVARRPSQVQLTHHLTVDEMPSNAAVFPVLKRAADGSLALEEIQDIPSAARL